MPQSPRLSLRMSRTQVARLRGIGQREYLVIQPLAPAAAESVVSGAAEAVKTLDDLGLVIRLV